MSRVFLDLRIPEVLLLPLNLLSKRITFLFGVSFLLLTLHILDDAFVVNEAAWYDISTAEFLLGCILLYAIVPPFGLWLARRASTLGYIILIFYSLQALYGAGLNHVRHLLGDFRGSQVLPSLLNGWGIVLGDLNGQGMLSLFAGMLGLNAGVPPHTHNMFSNVIVFLSIGVNLVLMGFIILAIAQLSARHWRKPLDGTHA